jgi:hypothetical protein
MRYNRRGEPIGRESGVYLYGASRPEVCRKVDPVGVTSASVRDQASTPFDCLPEPRNAVSRKTILLLMRSGSAQIENVEFRSRSDGVRGVSSHAVEAVVVEFIFTCDRCAEKIRGATGDQRATTGHCCSSHRNQTVNSPIAAALSPNSLQSLLRLFPGQEVLSSPFRNSQKR